MYPGVGGVLIYLQANVCRVKYILVQLVNLQTRHGQLNIVNWRQAGILSIMLCWAARDSNGPSANWPGPKRAQTVYSDDTSATSTFALSLYLSTFDMVDVPLSVRTRSCCCVQCVADLLSSFNKLSKPVLSTSARMVGVSPTAQAGQM